MSKIPDQTFLDEEDGSTRDLILQLLSKDRQKLPHNSWVRFNATSQEIYGLPMSKDVGKEKYVLTAYDSGKKSISNKFEIEVHPRPKDEKFSNAFAMSINVDYDEFISDPDKQKEFLSKLAKAFGDNDPSGITITSISKGSTVITWSNSSSPSDECDPEEMNRIISMMLDEDGNIKEEFREALKPYMLTTANFEPGEACEGVVEPRGTAPVHASPEPGEGETTAEPEPDVTSAPEEKETDVLFSTIIPVVVISVLVFIAILVACILCRRRKKQKGYKKADSEDKDALGKHTPVIFTSEMDDDNDISKSPSLMQQERPPRPPPEYHPLTEVPPQSYRNGRGQPYDQRYA